MLGPRFVKFGPLFGPRLYNTVSNGKIQVEPSTYIKQRVMDAMVLTKYKQHY